MPVTNYIWDVASDNLLMETDASGATTAVYTNEPDVFGELVSQRRGGVTSYYHFDAQRSTRELTDANQNVTDAATYTAFGEAVASSGVTSNPFGYQGALGYYVNPETNDLYVRARFYAAQLGRFMSGDPLGYRGSKWSLFDYVDARPITQSDPTGNAGIPERPIEPGVPSANGTIFCRCNLPGFGIIASKWVPTTCDGPVSDCCRKACGSSWTNLWLINDWTGDWTTEIPTIRSPGEEIPDLGVGQFLPAIGIIAWPNPILYTKSCAWMNSSAYWHFTCNLTHAGPLPVIPPDRGTGNVSAAVEFLACKAAAEVTMTTACRIGTGGFFRAGCEAMAECYGRYYGITVRQSGRIAEPPIGRN